MLLSVGLQAQGKTKGQLEKMKTDKILIGFISADQELLDHYNSGRYSLNAGRALGVISIGFMSMVFLSRNNFNPGELLLHAFAASVSGTIGIVSSVRGKSKIREVENFVRSEIGFFKSKVNLEFTDNGLGFVYYF